MNLLSVENVSKRYAEKQVLDGVSFGVDDADRVGVVGANGSGKSTLLRLVAGEERPDSGRVVVGNRVRVQALAQEPQLPGDLAPLEVVLGGDTPAARTARAFEAASRAVRRQPTDPDAQAGLELATRAMDAAGAWDVEHRARAVLDRLGVSDLATPMRERSGGQRKRVALARALVEPVDLLLLDEPTNHLDIDAIDWLEDVLTDWSGAFLLVTHDRYLLDRVTTRILEVDRGRVFSHPGGYSDYLEAREVRDEQAIARQDKRAKRASAELAWLRQTPAARRSKAKHRVAKAEELLDADTMDVRRQLQVDLPARRIGSKVVNLHNAGKRYRDRWVLRGIELKLAAGDRIGLVGPNGSGKTTLLRLIAGLEGPDEGSVRAGETVHVGYYGQDPEPLPPRMRVLTAVKDVVLETNTIEGINLRADQLLERFLFTSEAQQAYVSELSGGERRRLELLRVLADAPNLLLLDEPTNDLDLDTLAVLEDYLDDWDGTMVAASHDRFFLDRACEHIYSLEPDGSILHQPAGWAGYRKHLGGQPADRGPDRVAKQRTPRERSSAKLSYHEQRELAQLSERIGALEARKEELHKALRSVGSDHEEAAALARQLAEASEALDEAESRWLELTLATEED